jgi:hypothetical protein
MSTYIPTRHTTDLGQHVHRRTTSFCTMWVGTGRRRRPKSDAAVVAAALPTALSLGLPRC